jgi:hypothetical protein
LLAEVEEVLMQVVEVEQADIELHFLVEQN